MWAGWVHHSWRFGQAEALHEVGPEMPKRGWKTLSEQLLEFFRLCAIQMISCRNWRPWTKPGYITITRRQSNNQWSGGIAAHPTSPHKIPRAKIRWKSPCLDFLGSRWQFFSLIIFPRAKLSTRSITHLCWCNCRTLWRKNANTTGRSRSGSCSCTTMPRLTGHLQPRRNWPTWASTVLITHRILRIWPRRTTTCSLDWKKGLEGRHFSSDAEVIAAAETWLDGQHSEFFWSGLQKLEQRNKKYIELRGEYVG